MAINFVTNDDERLLQDIQRFYNTVIEVSARCPWLGCVAGKWELGSVWWLIAGVE